jgi:hypothetical protein
LQSIFHQSDGFRVFYYKGSQWQFWACRPPAAGYLIFNRLALHYRPMMNKALAAQGYGRVVFSTGLFDRCIRALLNQNDASGFALLNTPV